MSRMSVRGASRPVAILIAFHLGCSGTESSKGGGGGATASNESAGATADTTLIGGSAGSAGFETAAGRTAEGTAPVGMGGTSATAAKPAGGQVGIGGRQTAASGATTSAAGSTAASTVCITKRGFACGLEIASAPADIAALAAPDHGVSWYYGWATQPSKQMGTAFLGSGVEFVPMIWGHTSELTDSNLASKIYVGSNTKHLLGYNEPNFNSQANLTPEQAAAGWPYVEKAADQLGLELVAPAVNFCGGGCNATDPFAWVDQFLAACKGCRIDYVAFHSYACDSNWFINTYMKQAVKKYYTNGSPKRKIWLTEFACADSPPSGGWTVAQIQTYQTTVLKYLEEEPGIYRYAWFGGRDGRPSDPNYVTESNSLLAKSSSTLTDLGKTYTSIAEDKSCP